MLLLYDGIAQAGEQIVAGGGTWVYPFVGLSAIFFVVSGGAYYKWREIERKNFIS